MRISAKDLFLITVSTISMAALLLYLIFSVNSASGGSTGAALDITFQALPLFFSLPRTRKT